MKSGNESRSQDVFLALAALTAELTGPVLCMATVLGKEGLLSVWLEMLYKLLGGTLGLFFLTVYFCLMNTGEARKTEKIKKYWFPVLKAELWLLAIYYTWIFLRGILDFLRGSLLANRIVYIAAFLLLALGAVLAFSLFLPGLFRACGLNPEKGIVRRLLYFGMAALSAGILTGASLLWHWLSGMRGASVVSMLASHVFLAFCEYGVVCLLIAVFFSRKQEKDITGDVSETAEAALPAAGSRILEVGIPLGLTLLFVFLTGNVFPGISVVKQVAAIVEAPAGEGYASLEAGNLEKAVQCFTRAEARLRAFRSLVSEEAEESLYSVYKEYPDDVFIGALYLSDGGSLKTLEQDIRNCTRGSEWYPVLLRCYKEQTALWKEQESVSGEALSEEQEHLQKELLLYYISMEQFTETDCVFAQDLEKSRIAVLKQLQGYEDEFAVYGLLRLMVKYGAEGGISADLVNKALKLSEEKPYDLILQYAAYQIGSSYQEDSAGHYERTMEAAERFDRLYNDGTKAADQIAREKKSIGDAAARCYQYETALTYYEASYALSGEAQVALSCARIREKLGNYKECAEMAGQVLDKDPKNGQALYLMAIASLKTGDADGALAAAGRLGDLVADRDGPADVAEENFLYVCAQYLAMTDSTAWTDYSWQIYSSLNEEQIAEAQSHELLWDYMTAVYQCFMSRNYEEASQAVDNILAVRDDLPMAWYLRGTILFDEKKFEDAVEAFGIASACGGEAPAIYFSIANAYEAMGDYENARIYAKRVEEMLPYQDHGNDVYGISVHNKRLLRAVEDKLRR